MHLHRIYSSSSLGPTRNRSESRSRGSALQQSDGIPESEFDLSTVTQFGQALGEEHKALA